jgi:hypothetical protein
MAAELSARDGAADDAVRGARVSTVVAVGLGFALALLITRWPLPGMAAPLAVAAVVLLARHPQWLLVAFFTSLAIPIQRSVAGVPVNAADALLVLWLLLWPAMVRRHVTTADEGWRPPTLVLMVAPFVVAVAASQLYSINPGSSLKQLARVFEWFVLLPLLLTALRPNARFLQFAGVALMVLPCVFAVDGIFEYLNNGQSISGMLGIPVPVPEGGDNQIRHTYDVSGRAGSTFGGAQGLAMYLVMTLGFAIAHVVHPPRPWMRRVGLLCLAVSAGGLAVAQSRGGLLGAAALLLAIALTLRPTWRLPVLWLTVVATCVGVVVLGLWPSWDGTLAGLIPGRPEAVLDRLIIWGVALDVASENPLLGVGLGNFRDAFFEREAWLHVDLAYPSLHAHNTYLELLADTGWLGLCAYVGFLVAAAARLQRLWRNGAQPVLTLAAIGALAAYAVFASVDMLLLQNMHLLLVLVLSLGLATSGAPAVGVAMRLEDRR